MERQNKDDVRQKPTLDPNTHYWAELISKKTNVIIAFVVLITIILVFVICDSLTKDVTEILKAILFMAAGFLFSKVDK